MKLTDKNQREFVVDDVTSLFDMTSTFSWMEDSEGETVKNPREVEVLDAEGQPIDRLALADSLSNGQTMAVDVTFEATHSGRNRNYFNYNSEDLERGATSWKSPFSKPLLKNHDMYTEPLGRVRDFSFGPSIITDERDAITVTFRVTDQDAVAKFLDGRYQTMSIGASCGQVTCNICGKDILKDDEFKFCGHMRGQKYKGEMAYWTAKDFEFKEGSVVNNPADDFAQVIRVQVVKNDESHQPKDENEEVTVVQDEDSQALILTDAETSIIDELLQDSDESDEQLIVEDQETTDNESESSEPTITDEENEEDEEVAPTPTIEDLQAKVVELQALVDEHLQTIQAKDEEIQSFQATIQAKDEELASVQDLARQKEQQLNQQNVSLAIANKRLLVDMVLGLEENAQMGEMTDEAKEQRRQELSSMKVSELSDLFASVANSNKPIRRTLPPKVTSPGIVDNEKEKNVVSTNKLERKDKEESVNQPTMKDLTDAFVGLFTRQC